MGDDNPYRTPRSSRRGLYDYTLLQRVLRVSLVGAVIALALTSAILWNEYRQIRAVQGASTIDQLIGFFGDWRHAAKEAK